MKRICLLSLVALMLVSIATMAAPAYPDGVVKTQPDGSTITVFVHGDEYFHYFTLADGTRVEKNAEGYYVSVPALSEEEIIVHRNASPMMRRANSSQPNKTTSSGSCPPRGLIILVNFSDVKMQGENTQEAFAQMLGGETYTYNGVSYGSAKKYFSDQSYGKYVPEFDVVGPVTLSKDMAYYGANDAAGVDMHRPEMVNEACSIANADFGADFSRYDGDNDGNVDFVFLIYAGYAEAQGADANTIWPHQWDLYSGGIPASDREYDGKYVLSYACSSELQGYSGTTRDGIGTFCHEFSHVLGLPDLYATNGSAHKTLGYWDVMDSGNYNNNGYTPPSYSAYERFVLGWLKPTILNAAQAVTLKDLQSNEQAYLISETGTHNLNGNDPNPVFFYLLENRQQTGWDEFLPGHGMLITRVDYNDSYWWYNVVNADPQYTRVDLIEADGEAPIKYLEGCYGKLGDAFPAGATAYTPFEDYPITNISEESGVITFDFMGDESLEPSTFTVTVTSNNDEWGSVTGGGEYEKDSVIILTATPEKDYQFSQWSDGNKDNPRTIMVTSDTTLTAEFEAITGIVIYPKDYSAEVIWPKYQNANYYMFIVTKNGAQVGLPVVLIASAADPDRISYTFTDLEPLTNYSLQFQCLRGQELIVTTLQFSTKEIVYTGAEQVEIEQAVKVRKVVENGTIYIVKPNGDKYTIDGRKL